MNLFDSGIRPAIDAHLLALSKEKRNYGDYWSASSAGYCQRKVIFERLGVPHVEKDDDARKQRVFTAGHLFHDWIQGITKEAGLSIASEVELQDEDLMIRGHFDDLILVPHIYTLKPTTEETSKITYISKEDWDNAGPIEPPDTSHIKPNLILYDYKTVNSRSFIWAKKNGNAMNYSHRMQLGTYLLMIRRLQKEEVKPTWLDSLPTLTEARILKIEKENLMMMEQQLLWDTQLESDVLNYWNSLNAHWKAKTLPKCSCADHDNGFMASEKYNPYFKDGVPCSIEVYKEWKVENAKV